MLFVQFFCDHAVQYASCSTVRQLQYSTLAAAQQASCSASDVFCLSAAVGCVSAVEGPGRGLVTPVLVAAQYSKGHKHTIRLFLTLSSFCKINFQNILIPSVQGIIFDSLKIRGIPISNRAQNRSTYGNDLPSHVTTLFNQRSHSYWSTESKAGQGCIVSFLPNVKIYAYGIYFNIFSGFCVCINLTAEALNQIPRRLLI